MIVKKFENKNLFASNTYLLIKDKKAIIIDLGYFDSILKNELEQYDSISLILTHKHFDHINGILEFQQAFPDAKIYSLMDSNDFFKNPYLNCSLFMGENIYDYYPNNLIPLSEGVIKVDTFNLLILSLPGHTSDSISIIDTDENNMFTGDLIFADGIGRYDLPTGNYNSLINSLRNFSFLIKNNNYNIYPGHGEITNSKKILLNNVYIKNLISK